jgi:hypothetical protein
LKDPAASFTGVDEYVCLVYSCTLMMTAGGFPETSLVYHTAQWCIAENPVLCCHYHENFRFSYSFLQMFRQYICMQYFITTDYILKPVLSTCVVTNIDCSNQITCATLILLFILVLLKRLHPDASQLQQQQKGKLLSCYSSLAGPFSYI